MEKENKYYITIENIIRRHRKFPGLEAILEDIIDDVYSHSSVVLNTVSNENVLMAYLEKVVSTSIITVPKRLNFHSEVRHAVISPLNENSQAAIKVNNSLVDKMINSSTPLLEKTEINAAKAEFQHTIEQEEQNISNTLEKDENVLEEIMFSDDNEIENNINEIEDSSNSLVMSNEIFSESEDNVEVQDVQLVQNDSIKDITTSSLEEDICFQELPISVSEDIQEVSEELIEDNELNVLSSDSEDSQATAEDVIEEPYSEELSLISDEAQEIVDDVIEESDTEDLSLISDEDQEIVDDVIEESDTEDLSLISDEDQEIVDDVIEESDTEDLSLISNEAQEIVYDVIEESDSEDLSLISDDVQIATEDVDSVLELYDEISQNELESDNTDDFAIIDGMETIEAVENTEESAESVKSFKPIDYSKFAFDLSNIQMDIDFESIVSDIEKLDDKYPEMRIIEIYNYKYKDNMSISEIASTLNITESKVVDALNELVSVL